MAMPPYPVVAELATFMRANPATLEAHSAYLESRNKGDRIGAIVNMFETGLSVADISALTQYSPDHIAALLCAAFTIR